MLFNLLVGLALVIGGIVLGTATFPYNLHKGFLIGAIIIVLIGLFIVYYALQPIPFGG